MKYIYFIQSLLCSLCGIYGVNFVITRFLKTKALIRIARFGAPYQYDQSPWKDRLAKKVWLANVMFKLFLKKITFGLFPGQVMSILRNNDLTYRQVARRADAGTAVLVSTITIAAFKVLSTLL